MESKINLEDLKNEDALQSEETKESTPKIEEIQAELTTTQDKLLRALAEIQNLQNRHSKEISDISKYGAANAVKDLLAPYEHFFLAMNTPIPEDLSQNAFVNSFVEGVKMVQKEFEKIFSSFGVKRINPIGESFNPNFHQALSQIEDKTKQDGEVANVISAGYEVNGRLIKPAMVVVVKNV